MSFAASRHWPNVLSGRSTRFAPPSHKDCTTITAREFGSYTRGFPTAHPEAKTTPFTPTVSYLDLGCGWRTGHITCGWTGGFKEFLDCMLHVSLCQAYRETFEPSPNTAIEEYTISLTTGGQIKIGARQTYAFQPLRKINTCATSMTFFSRGNWFVYLQCR